MWYSPTNGASYTITTNSSVSVAYSFGDFSSSGGIYSRLAFSSSNSSVKFSGYNPWTSGLCMPGNRYTGNVTITCSAIGTNIPITVSFYAGTDYDDLPLSSTRTLYLTVNGITPTYTLGTAATGLKKTGSPLSLLTSGGSCSGGTLYYGVSSSDSVAPTTWYASTNYASVTATDVGTYYLWYKVTGDSSHSSIAATYWTSVEIVNGCPFSVNVSGTYYQCTNAYVNVNGTWKEVEVSVNVGGTWK